MRRIGIAIAALLSMSACATVRPHERENLSRRAMTMDQDPGEARYQQHEHGAREGAEGGTAHPGGGCGCN